MSDLYKGNSAGFDALADGYRDYAEEVISRRAIPDLRDGLKPVHRRILFSAYSNKKNGELQKCGGVVGDALKLHPHGDAALYGALTLMVNTNGSWNMPVFDGMGNLGHVYSSRPPAAMRYPKVRLNAMAEEYFKEKAVLDLVEAEEGSGKEPTVLLPTYPAVLVNGSQGIAVAAGTRIPSFNFGDVCDLVIKYLTDGDLHVSDIIYPDFPTGGVLVKKDSELAKIMATGAGKLTIRAKVEIVGKEIIVTEVPFGRTFESIIEAINKAEINEISEVIDETALTNNGKLAIVCKNKKVVDYVLMELYRRKILQTDYASNILVTVDGRPLIIGVHDIIRKWVEWRKSVLAKKFNYELAGISAELVILDFFTRLISNPTWRDEYVSRITKKSKISAEEYLFSIFPDTGKGDGITREVCDWIAERSVSAFQNGGKYRNRYAALKESKGYWEDALQHPDKYIINELSNLKKSKAGEYDRKTQISNVDYRFTKVSETEEVEDDSYCIYTFTKEGYILKTREVPNWVDKEKVMRQFEGASNSVLISFDNMGRIMRFKGTELDFTAYDSDGVYLPKFFEAAWEENYRVLYVGLCDGTKRMLVYKDGFIGFLDTNEWVDKKIVKYTSNGVCTAVMDQLLQVYEEKDIPQCLIFADTHGKRMKIGIVDTDTIPERSRTSRAKIFDGTGICTEYILGCSYLQAQIYIKNSAKFVGKLAKVNPEEDLSEEELNLEEGEYLSFNLKL